MPQMMKVYVDFAAIPLSLYKAFNAGLSQYKTSVVPNGECLAQQSNYHFRDAFRGRQVIRFLRDGRWCGE